MINLCDMENLKKYADTYGVKWIINDNGEKVRTEFGTDYARIVFLNKTYAYIFEWNNEDNQTKDYFVVASDWNENATFESLKSYEANELCIIACHTEGEIINACAAIKRINRD